MNNEEQLLRLKELKQRKNEILHIINRDNVSLVGNNIETFLELLRDINSEQKVIWKKRHKVRRLKYDQSDRGRELSRKRSLKNYYKKKESKLAQ